MSGNKLISKFKYLSTILRFVGLPDKITVDPVAHSWPGSATLDQGHPNAAQADP